MDFSQALIQLKAGHKIRRICWSNPKYSIQKTNTNDLFQHNLSDGVKEYASLAVDDIMGEDWEIVE